MESETLTASYESSSSGRVLAAAGPVLWIAISYIDPGKWAAAVEGGARFGLDLALVVLMINCAAILCQYLSAHVAIATGKDLAQICSEEYDDVTCMCLGVQAEISMIALDLMMVLGTAYGLHAIFGIDILNCVFLTAFDAVIFPFLASHIGNLKANIFSICLAIFVLVSYIFGISISQPEGSVPMGGGGMLPKLNGESAYALMSLLGASIMPHNFYLHSAIVQQDLVRPNISKSASCQDHFFATVCIFSGVFLLNCILMSLASSVFYTSGLVFLTLQDALSLLEQASKTSIPLLFLTLIIFLSNQIIPITWNNLERKPNLFKIEIPSGVHRAAIRMIAIIPALYCVSKSGTEGIFQLLVFTQVVVAIILPSSVIPLFRIASSRSIMGPHKVSQIVEFFSSSSVIGMLGIKIVFLTEMVFGSSEWVGSLKWSVGNSLPMPYLILLVFSSASLCMMLWLVTTPLKSASVGAPNPNPNPNQEILAPVPEFSSEGDEIRASRNQLDEVTENQDKVLLMPDSDINLPETLFDTLIDPINEKQPEITVQEPVKILQCEPLDASNEPNKTVDKASPRVESDLPKEKDDGLDIWEPEESTNKDAQSFTLDGPSSFRSLSGKSEADIGSGAGSLSRLAGLGRAARRQLTIILDEFWGQLFDFHGQAIQEAKAKKLDVLLGVESKHDQKHDQKHSPSIIGRGSVSFNPSKQNIGSIGSPIGAHHATSSIRSPNVQQQILESSERRYYSVHVPSSSDGYDHQPATIHGYELASYLSQMRKEQQQSLSYLTSQQIESPVKSNPIDPFTRQMSQKSHNGSRTLTPPGFPNIPVSRNLSQKTETPFHDLSSPEGNFGNNNPSEAKKFYSLPDISGLLVPHRESSLAGPTGYGPPSMSRLARDGSSWAGFNELSSPSKVCRDAFTPQYGSNSRTAISSSSLWSRQPYERFGVADKSPLNTQEPVFSTVELEAKLLQSFRSCIVKLLKLEGFDWLFRQNDGADEDLIDRVATREKVLYEVEARALDRKLGGSAKGEDLEHTRFLSVPNCGEGCVWKADIVVSFGVWCIHRILELSLMESRPELWGKYTYVLNRLQGIIDLAFSKPRSPSVPCFCLEIPPGYQRKPSPPIQNGSLPPPVKPARGKFTTSATLLDMIKDVEIAISCRKGRTGTAAGDVAFPKGKENLASVLKRYKRRLANKPIGSQDTTLQGSNRKVNLL